MLNWLKSPFTAYSPKPQGKPLPMPGVAGGQSSHSNQGKQLQSPNQLPKRKSVMHIPGLTKWEAPCPPNARSQPWKRCCGPKYNFESDSGETSLAYFPRKISKNYLQVLFWREDIITTQGGNTVHRCYRRWRNTEFIQWTNWWATENFWALKQWQHSFPVLWILNSWNKSGNCCPKWQLLDPSPEPWLTGFGHSKSTLSTWVRYVFLPPRGEIPQPGISLCLGSNYNPSLAREQSHSNSWDSLCPPLQYTPE